MRILLFWIFFLQLRNTKTERAGIRECSAAGYGKNSPSGGSAGTGTSYLMQDPNYQLTCCGVLDSLTYSGSGDITFQIWRQIDATNFELISQQDYTLTGTPFTPDDDKRVSFREGDLFGWTGNGINKASGPVYLNWVSASLSAPAVGDTHVWYSDSGGAIDSGNEYQIRVLTTASTDPYFRNLPVTLNYADTEMLVGGITLMTLSYNDIDPDDAADLTVSLSPAWSDLFELTTGTDPDLIKTKESLGPGTYMPVFRVEEAHCGRTASSTLTIVVTDSVPSIDNLPGFATVHEDDLDETLLHTVTMSDPTDQAMWCKGNWTIGTEASGNKPFIVKMLSTTAPGASEAGIYLIEDPQLDYDSTPTYDLTIECKDTFGNSVTGTFWVNVIKNQPPLFSNLANMVEVDASTAIAGTPVFTISSTDYDSDQITFTHTCPGTCPFDIFHSGEVRVKENLLTHTAASSYTISVTAADLRDTSSSSDLKIYIINVNNDPVFSNVNGQSVSVEENSALGLSLYQMSATDADSADTLTYFMTINDPEGYDLLQLSSSGELTTHSNYSINYDVLTTVTYTLTIHVTDGKNQQAETFTVNVVNENEAPYFLSKEFVVTQDEGSAGTFTDDPGIGSALDPDSGDTLTYTRDCGTKYDAYISIDASSGALSFAQDYDLETANMTTFIQCTVYVTDAGGLNDSASLYINIEYINDNSPVFDPNIFSVSVSSSTPMGYFIIQVSAIDSDRGDVGSSLSYSLSQASVTGGDNFIIEDDGSIYATKLLTSLKDEGSKVITVTVTDGTNTATATVTLNFIDSTVVISPTTDRNWEFIEDQRNITWLTMSVITMVTCLFLTIAAMIRCYLRNNPVRIDFKKLWPKSTPKRQLDKRRRPMPFGRQAEPQYRHVHANEVLRASPVVASPAPVAPDSLRPGSVTSRVTVTDVQVNENKWMDGHKTPALSVAPVKSITRPRTDDWEYMNPQRSSDTLSPDQMYGPETSTLSRGSVLSKKRRTTGQRLTTATHVPVSPSPVQFDNTGDDDDFRSERISIASPSSQLDPDEPIY